MATTSGMSRGTTTHDTAKAAQKTPPGFPTRHGADILRARQMAERLRWLVGGDAEPDDRTWQAMGEALWRGDPLADDLVRWMHDSGMARAWGQFEQAIRHPASLPEDAPKPLRQFVEATRAWPEWVDARRLDLGARVLQSTGLHGMMVLRDAGLMAGYQAAAINQTLIKTGSLNKGAQRRVAETTAWWLACTDEDGMQPGGPGFTMTLRVRVMHAMVRHQLLHRRDWDVGSLGLPVNQLDMQVTYLAFSVVQLLSIKTTGLWLTPQESEAVMHLWRYIGWLMGVEEALLCNSEAEGRRVLYQNVLSQAPADDSSIELARALMDEPLQRHYPNLPALRGRLNRARHLSLVRWFVGPRGMSALGLPSTWPWYPVLIALPLALRSTVLHLVPPLARLWTRHARRVQRDYLQVLMGPKPAGHLTGDTPQGANRPR